MKFIKFLLIIFITINSPIKADSKQNLINELKKGGNLIFIRHAYAPGSGDPDNFDINDMYLNQLKTLLKCTRLRISPENNIAESVKILDWALEIRDFHE